VSLAPLLCWRPRMSTIPMASLPSSSMMTPGSTSHGTRLNKPWEGGWESTATTLGWSSSHLRDSCYCCHCWIFRIRPSPAMMASVLAVPNCSFFLGLAWWVLRLPPCHSGCACAWKVSHTMRASSLPSDSCCPEVQSLKVLIPAFIMTKRLLVAVS
jgi:hypothetical protein